MKKIICCKDCKELIGKSRYTKPHKNLTLIKSKDFESMFGSVDEYYYKCKTCNTEWLLEKGNYGGGWIH
jgi:hypothetical protein